MSPYLPISADTDTHSLFQYCFDFSKHDVARFRGGTDQFQRLIDTLLGGSAIALSGDRCDSLLLGFISDMRVEFADDLGISPEN